MGGIMLGLVPPKRGCKERARNNFPICLASGGRIAALPLACVAGHTALGCALHCIPPDTSKSGNYSVLVPKPKSQKIPSRPIEPCHDHIQIDDLPVAAKGVDAANQLVIFKDRACRVGFGTV